MHVANYFVCWKEFFLSHFAAVVVLLRDSLLKCQVVVTGHFFRRDSYINKYCMKPDLDGSDITPLNRGWAIVHCLSLVNYVGCLSNSRSWFEKLARANKLAESLQSHFKRLEAFVVEAFGVHVNVTSLNFVAQDYVVYVVLRLKLTIPVLELT